MASNSIIQYSSSSTGRYEVFVSFRGETRNNFCGHLFGALRRKEIIFFKDDIKLERGKHILPELLQAFEGSQILVVVFSKDYASSEWCLRELENIASYIKESGKRVLPIFYDVTPSEVRNQSGNYKEAFDEYENRFKEDKEMMEEVQRWRIALSHVANLSGWHIGDKEQYGEIEKIVQNIKKSSQQNIVSSSNLVGIESRVKKLEKLLSLDSVDVVLSIGIYGMAGMGKTTLVKTLYDRVQHHFEFCYLIEDVSKIFHDSYTYGLQKLLLSQAPDENRLEICSFLSRTNLVGYGRRLIVLDNVNHIEQLEKLALTHSRLGPGSRIIIISKDKRILEDYGVNHVYHVQPLKKHDAIQLFCKHAFKGNYIMSEYKKLRNDVLSYIEGHPLLIKVLGSHLADQDISQWRNALARLRENPKKDIIDKLRISFDGLEQNEKEIFLDIACFYDWYRFNNVMEILQFCGFEPKSGLKTLLKKSLINNYSETWIDMPNLLIDLGKYIVKEKSPKEPRKWSRLWHYQDLLKVLSNNKAAKNLKSIVVDYYDIEFSKAKKVDALSKMNQLKVLILKDVKFSGNLNNLSNELAYLTWKEYPVKYLPSSFQPNNLVEIFMNHSNIKQLWKDKKPLPNLKRLDLSHSRNLVKMPNFEEAPNLEELKFEGCIKLRKIHPSVGCLKQLKYLNLKNCKSLENLPTSLLDLRSLEYLTLSGCSNLYNTPLLEDTKDANHFKKHWIVKVKALLHFRSTSSLDKKSFMGSDSSLLSLPNFPCMRYLNLSFCNLHKISDAIGNLCSLERLNLSGNKFEKMPNLKKLSKLVYINLEHCKEMKYLSELPSQTDSTLGIYREPSKIEGSSVYDLKGMGLHIFNCPKLVESKEWSRMTISWMIQMFKADPFQYGDAYYVMPRYIENVIPGNEIPKWFYNQRMNIGNSIKVDSTSMEHGNNWIGIVFCVVFVPHHEKNSSLNGSLLNRQRSIPYYPSVLLDVDLVKHKSDHMCLFYLSRRRFIHPIDHTFDSGDIEVVFESTRHNWHFEVKKHGYRWVYKQDL